MKKNMLVMFIFVVAGILMAGPVPCLWAQQVVASGRVIANQEALLARHEAGNRKFVKLQVAFEDHEIASYFHRRKIGEAIVEKDFVRYQFNVDTEELIDHTEQWRGGLPQQIQPVITKQQAEDMVDGFVRFSKLYIISPDSDVFRIEPTPENPCWVVSSDDGGVINVSVIDAVTGELLGYGTPPPYDALSIHGPDWGDCPQGALWYEYAENARSWFEALGYSTERVGNPSEATIQSHIQSDTTEMFYEMDHGGSWDFHNQCDSDITAAEVSTWIDSYSSMPFTFLGSCDGMCDQTANHFSYEFRKNSTVDTVTVGYCGMSGVTCEADCWPDAIPWQTELFDWMDSGYTVSYSFSRANLAFPDCSGTNNCTRFAGDSSLRFTGTGIPKVRRSLCGAIYNPSPFYFTPLPAVASTYSTRAHHIRCDSWVPYKTWLTIGTSVSYPYVDLAFVNDSKLTAYGAMTADGADGQIRFLSAQNRSRGMEFSGELSVVNGGQIKIYE